MDRRDFTRRELRVAHSQGNPGRRIAAYARNRAPRTGGDAGYYASSDSSSDYSSDSYGPPADPEKNREKVERQTHP